MADNTINLTETLTVSDEISKETKLELEETFTVSDTQKKEPGVKSFTSEWLFLEDEKILKVGKNLSENLSLVDQCSKYKQELHETFRIEIWRNGATLGLDQGDIENWEFTKSLTDEVGSGEVLLDNSDVHDFREGDEVRIYYGSENSGLEKLVFTGEVDSVERFWEEENAEQKLRLSILDYGKLLLETKITSSFATVTNINSIINSVLAEIDTAHDPPYPNERAINLSQVTNSNKTRTVDFVGESLLDCLGKLAFITQSEFYVDQNKRLQFFPRTGTPVKDTFGIDDFWDYNYEVTEDNLVNTVDVYGHQNKISPVPTANNPDPWSDKLTYWATAQGALFLSTLAVRAGTRSIANDSLGTQPIDLNLEFTFPSTVDLTPKNAFKELVFSARIISGAELTSFPKLEVIFTLEDSSGDLVTYPAEQMYDLLKTYEAPTEGSWALDASTHSTASESYVSHCTIDVACAGTERITLTNVKDIFRNTWFGIDGYSRIQYRFGGSGDWTTVDPDATGDDITTDPIEVLHTCTGSGPGCTTALTYTDLVNCLGFDAPDVYTRVRLTYVRAEWWSSGVSTAWMRFRRTFNGDTTYLGGWGHTGRVWILESTTVSNQGDPGHSLVVQGQGKGISGNQCCIRNLYAEAYYGTTAEKTYEPSVHITGDLGEQLEVRYQYKTAAGGGTYSKDRRIEYVKSEQVIPENLVEVRIPVGPDSEIEGKWEKSGANFDWSNVVKFNISTQVTWRGDSSEWARLLVDWIHLDSGKWFGRSSDPASMADPPSGHGIWFKEIFDDSIFSDTAASRWALEIINRYKDPLYHLRRAKGLLDGIENWNPGDQFVIGIPETDDEMYYYQLKELTLKYEDEEGTACEMTFEQLEAVTACIQNCGFESGGLSGWSSTLPPTISTGSTHSGTFKAMFDTVGEYIEQTGVNAPVDDIVTFSIWLYSGSCPWIDKVDVTITYSDSTTTEITNLSGGNGSYLEVDLTPYLTAGKIITEVKVEMSYKVNQMYVDDICLVGKKVAI